MNRLWGPYVHRVMARDRLWRWRGLTLQVPAGVFHPGVFFSSKFVARALEELDLAGLLVADVGCGSGLLALTAARGGAHVLALDINASAVATTQANAARNGLLVEALESDLFEAATGRRFDLVVVNPPYFAAEPTNAASRAFFAGADFDYFDRFFAQIEGRIRANTRVLMVLSGTCDRTAIGSLAGRYGLELRLWRRHRSGGLVENLLFDVVLAAAVGQVGVTTASRSSIPT